MDKNYFSSLKFREHLFQFLLVAMLVLLFSSIINNAIVNMEARNMSSGFEFLTSEAGFPILFSPFLDYNPAISTYFDTFLIGIGNTFLVSFLGIITATIVGFIVGIARLSPNFIVSKIASIYIETFRNIPLLLQVTFWYFAILIPILPSPKDSFTIFENFLIANNRGIYLAELGGSGFTVILVAILITIIGLIFLSKYLTKIKNETGKTYPKLWINLSLIIIVPVVIYIFSGTDLTVTYPEKGRFSWKGNWVIIPELTALWLALTIYTGTFIAENIRGGILAIGKGQTEAALSLGLSRIQNLKLVIVPQALRVIIPPQTSQYLNLTKNSSLAAAIGYPDLVAVYAGTALNQVGKAIEIISMTMLVYLIFSLSISILMNFYNKRIALVER